MRPADRLAVLTALIALVADPGWLGAQASAASERIATHCANAVTSAIPFEQSAALSPGAIQMLAGYVNPAGAVAPPARSPDDLDVIAASIARRSARVQPGELVWIEGGSDDVALMERLAVAVGAEGAVRRPCASSIRTVRTSRSASAPGGSS